MNEFLTTYVPVIFWVKVCCISSADRIGSLLLTSLVNYGPVHANAFSKERVFAVIENASVDSRPHYRFDAFSCLHQYNTCVRFRFDPLSRAFSNRCVFDENAECISVDGRAKRIEMYAFSNENALVWTSLVACVACVVTGYEHLNLDGAFRSVFYYSLVITVVSM